MDYWEVVHVLVRRPHPRGYDSIQRCVRAWNARATKTIRTQAFVPLSFAPGEVGQFDWSYEHVVLGGVTQTIKLAHFRLTYSRQMFVVAYSPSKAGAAFLPLTAVIVVANLSSVPLIRKVGYRVAISAGLGVAALGYAWLAALPVHASLLVMAPGMMLVTLGMGTAIPATTTVVIGSVDKSISGTASAILNTGRQFAGALGVALFGTMVSDKAEAITANIGSVYLISSLLLVLAMCKSAVCVRRTIVSHPLKPGSAAA